MKNKILAFLLITVFAINFAPVDTNAGGPPQRPFNASGTDSGAFGSLVYFFDLRDRETFIQVTYFEEVVQGISANMHVQIFDVSNNCNENDFFDVYTPNDTHTYNMRDIQTNDGNPSGVVLPDGAYGIVTVIYEPVVLTQTAVSLIGNVRVQDNSGFEYRTNAQFFSRAAGPGNGSSEEDFYSFNFNQEAGIGWSDVVGVTLSTEESSFAFEYVADPLIAFNTFDIDIINNNEVPFSCRDVIFACVNQESALLESLLEFAGTASVASFEYGINNAIPHTKGGELLCPGNVTGEGVVILRPELQPGTENSRSFFGFVGLNNGNGRGSLDSFWQFFVEPL